MVSCFSSQDVGVQQNNLELNMFHDSLSNDNFGSRKANLRSPKNRVGFDLSGASKYPFSNLSDALKKPGTQTTKSKVRIQENDRE